MYNDDNILKIKTKRNNCEKDTRNHIHTNIMLKVIKGTNTIDYSYLRYIIAELKELYE